MDAKDAIENGVKLDHPLQKVVLVDNDNVLNEHFEQEGKIVVPKDIKIEVVPMKETSQEYQKTVAKTNQYAMSVSEYEKQYHTVTAEEAAHVSKFGSYLMIAGILATLGFSAGVVPGLLRAMGFTRASRLRLFSWWPEATETAVEESQIVTEEVDIYSTPRRPPRSKNPRFTPKLKTP